MLKRILDGVPISPGEFLGDETAVLSKCDVYYFKSNKPHQFRNKWKAPGELITAFTPPTFQGTAAPRACLAFGNPLQGWLPAVRFNPGKHNPEEWASRVSVRNALRPVGLWLYIRV